MLTKFKQLMKDFLDKIAKQNEDLYGKGKVNCCGLNKPTETNKSDKR